MAEYSTLPAFLFSPGNPLPMLKIESVQEPPCFALFQLGFRPFFTAAALFGVIAIGLWMAEFVFGAVINPSPLPPTIWHAHEMVYGYTLAVVAGFLLTAVGNWTGIRSFSGWPLGLLALLWLIARIAIYIPGIGLELAAMADLAFLLGLTIGVIRPVMAVGQWKQIGILSKLLLLTTTSGLFYAGALGMLDNGMHWGLYGGLYLILSLVFMMARRVMPFFIERGVEEDFQAGNRRWLDIASVFLIFAWAVLEVFTHYRQAIAILALALFAMHCIRLYDWHTLGIWRKPLLWSLYLGYGSLVAGFGLRALSIWGSVSPFIALHAFAYGGIGMMTLGMMSRVALGHTGRNVFDPPPALGSVFSLLAIGALVRVLMPLLEPDYYTWWIGMSQLAWMGAFGRFAFLYVPMLMQPRVDGRPG